MSTAPATRPEDLIPTKKQEFERALATLLSTYNAQKAGAVPDADLNPGSYQSTDCVRCYDCMFTTQSADCFGCTYCSGCAGCSDCTHCHHSQNCHDSNYCQHATNCIKSSYVIHSVNCYSCVFCFGCVGLVKKEFHILNQPFPRKTYFALVEKLKKALGMPK